MECGQQSLFVGFFLLVFLPGAYCQVTSSQQAVILTVVGVVCLLIVVLSAVLIICCCMEKKRDSFRKIKARRDKPVSDRQTKVTVLGGAGGPTSVEMPQAVFNQPVMYNVDYDRMFGATVPYPGLENQIAGLETIDLARPAVPRAAPAQPKPEPKKKKTKPKKHVGTSDSSSSDEKKKKADEQKKVTSPPTSSRGDVQPMDMPLSSPKPPVEEKIEVIETPFGKMDEPDPMSDTDDLDF